MALQFLRDGHASGERGLYVTLLETTAELHAVAASHGWTLDGIDLYELSPPGGRADEKYTLYHPAEIELIELHGGRVEVGSEGKGLGATFTVILPVPAVIDTERERPSGAAVDAFAIRLPGRRVLVVDDDAATRELLSDLVQRAQAKVVTADSAAAAFAAFERGAPDVLIADIGLPGEDGLSLMRRIRSASGPNGGIPAIALSAYTRVEDRDAAYAAGFTDFVGKPAAPQDLLYAVQRVLD